MYSAPDRFAVVRRLSKSSLITWLLVSAGVLQAASVPQNLGNGLDKVVEAKSKNPAFRNSASNDQGNALFALAITDAKGRVLVRINPAGSSAAQKTPGGIRTLGSTLAATIPSLQVTAVDENYRGVGVMDAWVAVDDVPALGNSAGVRSVILELKPRHNRATASTANSVATPGAVAGDVFTKLGTTFDQGVTQHRVDQINQYYNHSAAHDYEGAGMSIGFISNSYDDQANAATDVTNHDLPGDAADPVNTQPVVVLQDDITGGGNDDEGRAMVQIGHTLAPKARLAFATADFGEVGFANNIRALAGMPSFTYPGQDFAADTICDDVGYFDEPYFQDGIIGQGINDVAAFGVPYFSSAGNDIGINGYESDLRWVANGSGLTAASNSALAGTNINLANVPPELYAGGFHNFNPVPGQLDVAQTVNITSNANLPPTVLQWNDPYDQNTSPTFVTPPLYTNTGDITGSTPVVFSDIPSLTAGTLYELDADADPGSSVDVTVTIKDPSGNTIVSQDNTVDEVVRFFAPVTGTGYTISIGRFATTTGPFHITLSATTGFAGATISTDVNLLVFNAATGAYLPGSSLVSNNFATNEPIELGFTPRPSGATQVQYVISRRNVPANGGATHVRYVLPGNGVGGIGPAEYFSYNAATTGGHAMANGSNGMAAYSVFRPSLPETFTSPGPVRIYFDDNGLPLTLPEVRRQPRLAAADTANISSNMSFFSGDSAGDPDSDPNFSGTSAAGPHAAAIGALVMEAHGGRHSLTSAQMTTLLEHNTFAHDLDPSFASGTARTSTGDKVTISISSDADTNGGTGSNDTNSFSVTYAGSGNLMTLVFNPQATALTAGNVSGGNNGYQDVTPATTPATISYFENSYPGMVFLPSTKAFTVGTASNVPSASVTASYANLAPPPSNNTSQWWTMTLTLNDSSFTTGKVLRYVVARGVQHSASVAGAVAGTGPTGGTTSASYLGDLFGGGVSIPSGAVNLDGMTFSGTTSTGTFSGVIRNRVNAGYSPVDGYGLINAEAAVGAPTP